MMAGFDDLLSQALDTTDAPWMRRADALGKVMTLTSLHNEMGQKGPQVIATVVLHPELVGPGEMPTRRISLDPSEQLTRLRELLDAHPGDTASNLTLAQNGRGGLAFVRVYDQLHGIAVHTQADNTPRS